MSNEEKKTKIEELLVDQDVFLVKDVIRVNHKPHPYCITLDHMPTNSMYLNEHSIEEAEKKGARCGMYISPCGTKINNGPKPGWNRCTLSYDEHISDLVCFLYLKRNASQEEVSTIMKKLVEDLGGADNKFIDGFAFIKTKEKFRIT